MNSTAAQLTEITDAARTAAVAAQYRAHTLATMTEFVEARVDVNGTPMRLDDALLLFHNLRDVLASAAWPRMIAVAGDVEEDTAAEFYCPRCCELTGAPSEVDADVRCLPGEFEEDEGDAAGLLVFGEQSPEFVTLHHQCNGCGMPVRLPLDTEVTYS